MSSSAAVRVEKATSSLLLAPDWTMNMEICDSINMELGLAKDVVRSVKKRLQHKSPMVQFLALTLLETMIKNCGDFVHFQVVEREIPQEMVKIVKKKTNIEVRDKILVLLDSWQRAFGGSAGKYPQYYLACADLKRHGVDFPHCPEDATLRYVSPTHHSAAAMNARMDYDTDGNYPARIEQTMPYASATLSTSDLDRIRGVMELLADMLKVVNPHHPEAVKDDEVIGDLADQCHSNQKKVLQSIESIGEEKLLEQSLALNDSLQSLLAKHDAMASGESSPLVPPPTVLAAATVTSNRFEDKEEEDDDEFAQLARRNSKLKQNFQIINPISIAHKDSGREITPFTGIHSLALPEPPPPIKTTAAACTTTRQEDIIDLLSVALSSNSTQPYTPIIPSIPPPVSPMNPKSPPAPYSFYAAPWSQSQLPSFPATTQQHHLQAPQVGRYDDYPPPPWEDDLNFFDEPAYRFQAFSIPYNSFGTTAATPVATTGQAPATSHQPFGPSHRLFDDLADVSNPNNGVPGWRTGSPTNKV